MKKNIDSFIGYSLLVSTIFAILFVVVSLLKIEMAGFYLSFIYVEVLLIGFSVKVIYTGTIILYKKLKNKIIDFVNNKVIIIRKPIVVKQRKHI